MIYYEKAVRQGHSANQFNTGCYYRDGHLAVVVVSSRGCEQSYARAADWFEKAAEQGNAEAINELEMFHYNGYHFPQNYERALELYRMSAALATLRCVTSMAKRPPELPGGPEALYPGVGTRTWRRAPSRA